MNAPMINPINWLAPIDVGSFPRTYEVRRLLSHVFAKILLNPLTLCFSLVALLYRESASNLDSWAIAAALYLSATATTQLSIIAWGKHRGWLEDPLAPRAEVRPMMYLANTLCAGIVLGLMFHFESPIELKALCFAQLLGLPMLAVQTLLSKRRSADRGFKSSMHVFAATLFWVFSEHYQLVCYDGFRGGTRSLVRLIPLLLLIFIAWGRLCHVPKPEHTLLEVVAGAGSAFLAAVIALTLLGS